MDPQTERWPHVDIVRAERYATQTQVSDELKRLQNEKAESVDRARSRFIYELTKSMRGELETLDRITRRTSMRTFTQRMHKYGERILNEQRQNGGTIPD